MDRNLAAFLAVAEESNLTAAARRLNITQPSLTKRIQQLEADYDCQLFERLPRGVCLTDFGRRLMEHAERIAQEYRQSHEAIAIAKSDQLSELRIGAGPLFHLRYLAPAIETLQVDYPRMRLRVMAGLNPQLLPRLRNDDLDIVFGANKRLFDRDPIEFIPLTVIEHGLVLSTAFSFADKDAVTAHELQNMRWIVYYEDPTYLDLLRAFFQREGLPTPDIAIQTTSLSMGLQLAAGGRYIMTMPVELASTLHWPSLQVIRTDPPLSRVPTGAFVRHSAARYPAIRRLIEIVAEKIASGAGEVRVPGS